MSKKPFDGKFSKDLYILNCATKGELYLGDYPKLLKKLKKYFEQQNVEFCGEPESDNLYLIDLIKEELNLSLAV